MQRNGIDTRSATNDALKVGIILAIIVLLMFGLGFLIASLP